MSEIWYVGKELIRSGQLKGLDPDTVTEMCARTYDEKNGKVVVEPKDKMKKRTKKSPDRADSLFVTLHLARMRHNLKSTEKAAPRHQAPHTPILNRRDLVLSQPMQPRRANLHDLAENVGSWAGAGWGEQGW
jgi:hypothetical protein